MDPTIIMWVGFIMAGYAVVGNDSIQTLGTFLSSNEDRPWYTLWIFAGGILSFTLLWGWYQYGGDVSYGRLEKYEFIDDMTWPYLLPPLVLMLLTRTGIPVSTSFLILTFFKPKGLFDMTMKSVLGYALAFCVAIIVWQLITNLLDRKFIHGSITRREKRNWTILQWSSTGFLWGQWLIQDFANIYVYLPRALAFWEIMASLAVLLFMLAVIFYSQGGSIQKIVKAKTNTTDIRSATIIDFIYGLILLFFKEFSNVPMSTTWVFLGLLAGREIAIRYKLQTGSDAEKNERAPLPYWAGQALNLIILALIGYVVYLRDAVDNIIIVVMALAMISRAAIAYFETRGKGADLSGAFRNIFSDLGKVTLGLVVSIGLVYLMKFITSGAVG